MERKIGLCYLSPFGRFQARIVGRVQGNVVLRKTQYFVSTDIEKSRKISISLLIGKISNCRKVLERAIRDHAMLVDIGQLNQAIAILKEITKKIYESSNISDLMGYEGIAAKTYFGVFNQLIIQQKDDFHFSERTRRPPLDNTNSVLSFLYTLLTYDVASALEAVGLDPYVGFLHQDRPGRPSLALDVMEELRPVFADRLALTMINRRQIKGKGFLKKESGGVLMDDDTRKEVLGAWQERKRTEITHPFLKERVYFGLIPHIQARLMARFLRGDLDAYPPYFWS